MKTDHGNVLRLTYEFDIRRANVRAIGALTEPLEHADAFDAALERVSSYRRAKVLAFRFAQDRRLSLLAGLLLDELLGEHGLRERDMTYLEGDKGKPSFASAADLHFSLAHSGNMAVATLSQAPVGIDVEHLPGFPRDIAEPCEWTTMESVGKLLGCGIGTFVDGSPFRVPDGVSVEHIDLDDYLVCLAFSE